MKIFMHMSVKNQPTSALDTTNPEHLLYEHSPLSIAVLGGIRLDGLDRMRATLKLKTLEEASTAVRHNLDLYNHIQVEKLVRRVAERLEIGSNIVDAALASLTEELEAYRIEKLEAVAEQEKLPQLSKEEMKAAKLYLSSPNLIERTREDIGKSGVIGEADNRLLLYLIYTSRKRAHPLHAISLGSSGIGKTHLQEQVAALIPEEDKLEITSLSGNAFYYFGRQELRHKLIIIEDLDGAEDVLYPLREIQSKKRITKTIVVKDQKGGQMPDGRQAKTETLTVEGPVSVSGCTTKESLYEDNANRSFLLYIDESPEQDERIMSYQRKLSAGKIDIAAAYQIRELLKNTQRILKPVTVRNPYAEQLKLPAAVFKPRRTNAHYLAFIEAVTFYHQYQREEKADEQTGEVYIETTLEDIQEANGLLKEVLLRKSDPLNAATRSYLEQLKDWLKEANKTDFTNQEVRQALRVNPSNQKRYMLVLQQHDYVVKVAGEKGKPHQYKIVQTEEYKQLKEGVSSVLDELLEQLRKQEKGKG
jgi:hypothetical protein